MLGIITFLNGHPRMKVKFSASKGNRELDVNVPAGVLDTELLKNTIVVKVSLIEQVVDPRVQRDPVVVDEELGARVQIRQRIAAGGNLCFILPLLRSRQPLIHADLRILASTEGVYLE